MFNLCTYMAFKFLDFGHALNELLLNTVEYYIFTFVAFDDSLY